jgi:hypothetical protein
MEASIMTLTDEEKQKLREKIEQEPAVRKERHEKYLGISIGVVLGLLFFPLSVVLGTYWMMRGNRTRGAYMLMTFAWIATVNYALGLFSKSSILLIDRLF